jgi:leader peptidase (prepilin peptidase)/N-methyltransferase
MFETLPVWLVGTIVFLFGAIIGSFLNVVIYRFHTGKSINGESHCLSCLNPLLWYELFPLFSYVFLQGRCRSCLSYIPPRYFVVELMTAVSFVVLYPLADSIGELILMAILVSLLIVTAVYDIYHYVIPNEFVLAIGVVALVWFGLDVYEGVPSMNVVVHVLSALGAFGFFAGLWLVSKGRWIGFGDAKLAVPLAFIAGFPATLSMIVLSFWVGAIVSLLFLFLQKVCERGKVHLRFFGSSITMKSEVPFAPFLIAGFLLSAFLGVEVLSLVSYVF